MKKTGLLILGALVSTSAYAWNPSYACTSNDAKKTKVTVATLDPEIVRTHQDGAPDRRRSRSGSSSRPFLAHERSDIDFEVILVT